MTDTAVLPLVRHLTRRALLGYFIGLCKAAPLSGNCQSIDGLDYRSISELEGLRLVLCTSQGLSITPEGVSLARAISYM